MDKEFIIHEIKRIAEANNGKAPGLRKFESETSIRHYDWFPDIWLKWSEALKDAGFTSNKMQAAYTENYLIEKLALLIRELNHFPTSAEIRRKNRQDNSFPSVKTIGFKRFGGKIALIQKLVEFCENNEIWRDVAEICADIVDSEKALSQKSHRHEFIKPTGVVYLIKSGKHYKIGKSKALGRREYELSIQLPEPPNTVHAIKTDDPAGIEAYWHNRFASKRKGGEWFDLTADDVKAFKMRKFM